MSVIAVPIARLDPGFLDLSSGFAGELFADDAGLIEKLAGRSAH